MLDALDSGITRAVAVHHRGAGKDLMCLNYLIKKAYERPGVYLHCFPNFNQGKRAIWKSVHETHDGEAIAYLDHIPEQLIKHKNSSEMMIELKNGSIYCVMGLDGKNAARARGMNPNFVILSEYAYMDPESWHTVEPRVAQNKGTAIFISCVAPNTMVFTENGLQQIEKISDRRELYSELNKNIWGLGGFHTAQKFYYGGKQKTLKITLNSGYALECTPVHKIWTGKEWIKSSDLKTDDYIPVQYGQDVWGKGIDISGFAHNTHGSVKFKVDDFCHSEDFLYLLGLINGDGYFSESYVIIANTDKEVVDFLHYLGFKSERGGTHHRLGSKELCSLLVYLGFKKGAKNKEFPRKLFSGTKNQIRAFLQGIFDADGTSNSCKKKRGSISFSSTCLELIKNIQIVLLNFGIVSSYRMCIVKPTKRVKVTSICYALEIGGYFAEKFYNEIGFRIARKQQNKKFITKRCMAGSGNVYPIDTERLKDYKLPKNLVSNPKRITRRLIEWLNNRKPHPYFAELLSEKFFYSPIKSIEESENEVFDFVIPDTHSFFSNGFISHNTPNGQNHFYDLYNHAKNSPQYFASLMTIEDTKTISLDHIESLRKEGVPEDFIQQEYFCSWTRGAEGSYYGKYMQKARDEDRLTKLRVHDDLPCHSAWDLGIGDSTSIWIFQALPNGNYNFLDYYENHGESLEHYAKYLKKFQETHDIIWDKHFLPHDAASRELIAGIDRVMALRNFGIIATVLGRDKVDEGIQAVRSLLNRCYFDAEKCKQGLKCLDFYCKKYNEAMKIYYNTPLHNRWSHGADSFRYFAIGAKTIGFESGSAENDIQAINAYWNS